MCALIGLFFGPVRGSQKQIVTVLFVASAVFAATYVARATYQLATSTVPEARNSTLMIYFLVHCSLVGCGAITYAVLITIGVSWLWAIVPVAEKDPVRFY